MPVNNIQDMALHPQPFSRLRTLKGHKGEGLG